jgi:hypothetical protein
MPWLWVPVLVLAHVFAGSWLCRTLLLGKRHVKKAGPNLVCNKSADTSAEPSRAGDPADQQSTLTLSVPQQQLSGTSPKPKQSAAGHSLPSYGQLTGGNSKDVSWMSSSVVDVEAVADAGWSTQRSACRTELCSSATTQPNRVNPKCADSEFRSAGGRAASCTKALKEMTWSRVGCTYKAHGVDKVVLQGVWGAAVSGEVQVRCYCC